MEFIDTHCHIQGSTIKSGDGGEAITRNMWQKAGFPTGDELIVRATDAGVRRMICVGCTIADSELAVEFVQSRDNCVASIGIHPHEAKDYSSHDDKTKSQLQRFAAMAAHDKVVAVGECGLDYFYEHSAPAEQARVLHYQIRLALEHDLPMIFHVREAFDDFWPIFDQYDGIRGVLHSFTDSPENLAMALERGLYIGVNGIATFTKSDQQREMYKSIPLSRLLLETDAPYLTPSPYRGNICEPYHTSVTAKFLAELRNEALGELAEATSSNAKQLFRI
ncbi:MAG TPA: TatD family hydrolase [Candidatus Saccharimonadales bacterium]|jgi:TatD DNase family protein